MRIYRRRRCVLHRVVSHILNASHITYGDRCEGQKTHGLR